ncbi:MAG: ankyrin repeat domain-containing protein [Burkholderiales bacterium]|nr:ankyrin repeat domain-containing protein [Burkholderiales bacterium]
MALLPSFENILLEVHQSLGLERDARKKKFAAQGMRLEHHIEMTREMLHAVFKSLDMDEQACRDAMTNCLEWANFHKNLELKTWTGNASGQQVLWHFLAYAYVPWLARRLAFWDLAGQQRGIPFDAGMPGGEFWFLPLWDRVNGTLTLPVPQVIDWLLDLLDAPSLQGLDKVLGKKTVRENPDSNLVRTLQNWRKGTGPQSAEKIEELFPEDAPLNFAGVFLRDESLTLEAQFQAAVALVLRKGLITETLRHQIPMSAKRLEPVLNGNAPEDEKQEFVRLIALRYARPCMHVIRQRLRVARMAQDGYKRLLKTLCGENIEPGCADPAQNKLLQLIPLFQSIYNLTIGAYQNAGTVEEEDAWFEARLAPWDKADLLLSIVPSRKETAYLELAQRLTRKFMAINADSPLEDLVALGEPGEPGEIGEMGADAKAVIERRCLSLQQELEEDLRLIGLIEKVRRASPWRALEAEPSYWVLSQFAHEKTVSPNARAMAIKRMRELATTPGQAVGPLVLELSFLLNGEPKQRPKDIQQRVQSSLDEAEANSQGYEEWKAPLLRLRAKHRLMQNDFKGASKDFKDALAACSERGFGAVRGEIARDGWATAIAVEGFMPWSHEPYYRSMLWFDIFPDGQVSFEDAAMLCEDFFWTDLYHPYPGFEREERLTKDVLETVLGETFGLIEEANWEGLQLWMKRHAKKLRKANFKDARCDSVLLLWLKMLHTAEKNLPAIKADLPLHLVEPFKQVESHILNRRKAIELLIQAWPEQAKIADFKGQTPLMLAADNGNAQLTGLLAPLSDVDAQDHVGRTALHSSVSGRSPECVTIVLERKPGVVKVTKDEQNTALHTAVRFGQPESVRLILEYSPSLALQPNISGDTPLKMAKDLLEDLPGWQAHMRRQNRRTGEKADFEAIIFQLEVASALN